MDNTPSAEDLRWEYEHACQLYKFYWDIALKAAAYFYTLTGALGSFFVINRSVPNLLWILLIPAYLGCMLGIISILSCIWVGFSQTWLDKLVNNKTLRMKYRVTVYPLALFLGGNAIGFLLVAALAVGILTHPQIIR